MIRNSARPFLLVAATLICWSTLPAPALADTVSFVGRRDFASGGLDPSSVAVGDFNGDGVLDLAVVNGGSGTVSVLLGNGDGSFRAAPNIDMVAISVAVGDLNGDGIPDLAVVPSGANFPSGANSVSVLLGNGDGTFQAARNFATLSTRPFSAAVGDFNGDGVPDLAVAGGVDLETSSISVLLGNGDGTFQAARGFATGSHARSVAVGDFNGDGVPDLAVANAGSDSVSVLLGNGDGSFQAALTFTVGKNPRSVAVGDFNGDGMADLAGANRGSYTGSER